MGDKYQLRYGRSSALLVGISAYSDPSLPRLDNAVSDAEGVAAALAQCGFDERVLLLDARATKAAIIDAFVSMGQRSGADDRLIVYISAHATRRLSPKNDAYLGYLQPYDAGPALSTLIAWDELLNPTRAFAAKHIFLVFDACFSGLALERGDEEGVRRHTNRCLLRPATQVLCASKPDQTAADGGGPLPNHSPVAGHLIEAIRGAASDQGVVLASDVMHYVEREVRKDRDARQTPDSRRVFGTGDMVIAGYERLAAEPASAEPPQPAEPQPPPATPTVPDRLRPWSLFAWAQHIAALAVIVAVAMAAEGIGLTSPLARLVLDLFAVTAAARPAAYTAVVEIDDASYGDQHLFQATSPLNHGTLANLILEVARSDPKAIVVDVDTSPLTIFADWRNARRGIPHMPIVWAASVAPCGSGPCVLARDPLAGWAACPPQWTSGVDAALVDGDGGIRRYRPMWQVGTRAADGGCACSDGLTRALPRAAAIAAGRSAKNSDDTEPITINWRDDRYQFPRFTAAQVLTNSRQPWWKQASAPLQGRVVLIGGTFKAGRDSHSTPAGEMPGVDILAHFIELEIGGGGMPPFTRRRALLLDITGGLGLMLVNAVFFAHARLRRALDGFVVLAVPLLGGWLLYRYSVYWANLAPVLLGVGLYQWHERADTPAASQAPPLTV